MEMNRSDEACVLEESFQFLTIEPNGSSEGVIAAFYHIEIYFYIFMT